MRQSIMYLTLLLLTFSGVFGQGTQQFSLEEAIDYAIQNNLDLQLNRLELADAEYQIKETTSVGIPQINGEVGLSRYLQLPKSVLDASFFNPMLEEGEVYTELPIGVKNSLTGGVDLSTLLFDYSYLLGLQAARKLKSLTKKQADLTELQIRQNVRDAYLPNLIFEISESTLTNNIENLKKTRYETKVMYDNGFVEQLDIDRLDLSISNLQIQLKSLKDQQEVFKNILKFQMNYPIEDDIVLTDGIDEMLEMVDDVDLEGEVVFANRPEFVLFKERRELNEINHKRLKAGKYPSGFGFASYQLSMNRDKLFKAPIRADGSKIGFIPSFIIGIQANIPIFDGFARKNSLQRSLITIDKIKIEEEKLRNALAMQVKNSRLAYKVAKENLETTKANVTLAEKIYRVAKIKYKEGIGSSLEIHQAEQSLFTSQSNHLNALYNLLVAKKDLENALGK